MIVVDDLGTVTLPCDAAIPYGRAVCSCHHVREWRIIVVRLEDIDWLQHAVKT